MVSQPRLKKSHHVMRLNIDLVGVIGSNNAKINKRNSCVSSQRHTRWDREKLVFARKFVSERITIPSVGAC
jgi:hypothetical protein